MEMKASSSNSPEIHFLDVREVVIEANEEQEQQTTKTSRKTEKTSQKHTRRPYNFSRQVSLETGVSVLKRDSKLAQNERKALPRSGRSFGAYGSAQRFEGRSRGDFNMFRTKSGLNKQNSSMLPLRKERDYEWEFDDEKKKNVNGGDESVNKSVPAGRYFAALTGPELDQVKVITLTFACLVAYNISLYTYATSFLRGRSVRCPDF